MSAHSASPPTAPNPLDWSDMDLSDQSFSAHDLRKVSLVRADIHGTRFFGADLREVNLTDAKGISEEQFGGANLFRAKLPERFDFTGVQHVRELAGRAERTFLVLVVACATTLMISYVREPVHLFRAASPVVIPGVGLQVPLSAFYLLTPIILLALHVSLSFSLLKLSYALTDLPAVFPNGRSIDQQGTPPTPNFAVLACPHSRFLRTPLSRHTLSRAEETRGERWLIVLLVWWAVPLTLVGMWWSYLPRHDEIGTFFHALAITVAVWVALDMHRRMCARFRFRYPDAPVSGVPALEVWFWPLNRTMVLRRGQVTHGGGIGEQGSDPRPPRPFTIIPAAATLAAALLLHGASDAAVVGRGCGDATGSEPTWFCELTSAELAGARLDSLDLQHLNLAAADLEAASLRGIVLEEAEIQSANLSEADLRGAKLKDAKMWSADLREATLDSANLKESRLQHADLRGASLRHALLNGARLSGARIKGADVSGAIVCGADFGTREALQVVGVPFGGILATPMQPDALTPADIRTDSTPPAYLSPDNGYDEYPEWRAAWLAVAALPTAVPRNADSLAALHARVERINLSMANRTQDLQDRLAASLRSAAAATSGAAVAQERLDSLRSAVREKARNHCVQTQFPGAWPTR